MSTRRASLGLIAAVIAAASLGFFLSKRLANHEAPPPAIPPAILPAESATVVPAKRPVFALRDTAGVTRSITEWDGRALIVNFWATWCPPCRRELPLLNVLQRERGTEGFQVLGIAVDFREAVLDYLKQTPVGFPVLIGEQDGLDAARAFGIEAPGFPFTIFTDRNGNIVALYIGELHRAEADVILGTVAQVNEGRLDPQEARKRIEQHLAGLRKKRQTPPLTAPR